MACRQIPMLKLKRNIFASITSLQSTSNQSSPSNFSEKSMSLSSDSSISSLSSEFDDMENRINEWLDLQNIKHITPDQHFRDYFQQSKEIALKKINDLEFGQTSPVSEVSNLSFDIKKSPILARRQLNKCQQQNQIINA